jgi:CheY-like chemotaxis protein
MVEAMGGAIGFETISDSDSGSVADKATGHGTTFTFSLPLAVEIKVPGSASPAATGIPESDADRVLICEDDHDVANLLKLLLERAGFPADVAYNLSEARRMLDAQSYAALTLDLMLPDGDGLEFLRELRADPLWKDLPVVVVSAKADEGRRDHEDQGGDDSVELVDWVSKPINESTLVHSLQRATRALRNEQPRILHVEDNDDLRKVLGDLFQGHAVVTGAATLREARELLKSEPFDLIVLDIGLPDGSGLELMEDFDTLSGRPVPVLILSASEPADAALRKRVAAVLLKSRVSEERVVQTVLNLLRKRPSRPQAAAREPVGV